MKYKITFSLSNGDAIRVKVEGINQEEALAKIQNTPAVVEKLDSFIEDNATITKVDIVPDNTEEDKDLSDYSIQEVLGDKWLYHHTYPQFYARIVRDKEPLRDIEFVDVCDELTAATAMRRAGDFIIKEFNLKIN